jgi:hypothetical protein
LKPLLGGISQQEAVRVFHKIGYRVVREIALPPQRHRMGLAFLEWDG